MRGSSFPSYWIFSIKFSSSSFSVKGISITRLNQNLSETKPTTKADLTGEIDFDAAEAKRKDAEKKVEQAKEEKQNQTVKRIKKPSTSEVKVQKKPSVNTKIQFKEKQDSKKDKRELEGEKGKKELEGEKVKG